MESTSPLSEEGTCDGRRPGQRDAEYIRGMLPLLRAVALYHRFEAQGFEHIPASGPALLVGNHSGGLLAQDATLTLSRFYELRGVETPVYSLIHPSAFKVPSVARHLARTGGLHAHPRAAMAALQQGAYVLVYPGGGDDSYRTFDRRHLIEFAGRSAFVRLALRERVPIVPIVTLGAHETLIVLNDGKKIAQVLGLTEKYGVERLPISLSLPWGLTIGVMHHIPVPVQIRIRVGKPIVFRGLGPSHAKDRDIVQACFEQVQQEMQRMLDEMVAERHHGRR